MIRALLVPVAASLFACNGCSHDGSLPGATPGAGGADPLVHVEDDGKTIEVARGGLVTFKLASNGGTGYSWMPAAVDGTVLVQEGPITSEVSSDTPGAPKMDVLHLRAAAAGTVTLELDLKRPFGNQPPGRVIHVTVHVR